MLSVWEPAQLLVEKGARINARDARLGETAVDKAGRNGHMKVVQMMLNSKPDVTLGDKWVSHGAVSQIAIQAMRCCLPRALK